MNMNVNMPTTPQRNGRKFLPGTPSELRPWIPRNLALGMIPGSAADAAAMGKAGGEMAACMTIRLLQLLEN